MNNAGVVSGKVLLDCSDEQIQRTFDVNVLAHFWVIYYCGCKYFSWLIFDIFSSDCQKFPTWYDHARYGPYCYRRQFSWSNRKWPIGGLLFVQIRSCRFWRIAPDGTGCKLFGPSFFILMLHCILIFGKFMSHRLMDGKESKRRYNLYSLLDIENVFTVNWIYRWYVHISSILHFSREPNQSTEYLNHTFNAHE